MLEELKHFSQVLLPVFAALGGVIFPALVFVIINLNAQNHTIHGWAIPTATDIAFAVGFSTSWKKNYPSLKIFVQLLAIMDDLCAIVIVLLFYTNDSAFIPFTFILMVRL